MTPTVLTERRVRLHEAIDGFTKTFVILEGHVNRDIDRLTLVLLGCIPQLYGEWLGILLGLVKDNPQLSLYQTPDVANVQFMVGGQLPNPKWVADSLISKAQAKKQEELVGVYTVDLKPVRLRWQDVGNEEGGIVIKRPSDREVARRLIVSDKGHWLNAPSEGALFCVFFSEGDMNALAKARIDKSLAFRDLYEKTPTQQEMQRLKLAMTWGRFEERTPLPFVFTSLAGVGFVEVTADNPYRFLTEWRRVFCDQTRVAVEIAPLDVFSQSEELIDNPNVKWSGVLDNASVDKDGRIRIGRIRIGVDHNSTAAPEFEVQKTTTVVLGGSQQGKSVVAFYLLARYLSEGYSVVYWNCLKGTSNSGNSSLGDGSMRHPDQAIDFASIVWQVNQRTVIALRPEDLLEKAERGGAYYTELNPEDRASAALCEQLDRRLQNKLVYCFDEIVNCRPDAALLNYFGELSKLGRHSDRYYMLIHQSFKELVGDHGEFTGPWPGVPDSACFFLKGLESRDEERFRAYLEARNKQTYFEDPQGYFRKMNHTEIAVFQPYLGSNERPIPLSLPSLAVATGELKKRVAPSLSWGETKYDEWLKS